MSLADAAPQKQLLDLFSGFAVCPDFKVVICPENVIRKWTQIMSMIFSLYNFVVVVVQGLDFQVLCMLVLKLEVSHIFWRFGFLYQVECQLFQTSFINHDF